MCPFLSPPPPGLDSPLYSSVTAKDANMPLPHLNDDSTILEEFASEVVLTLLVASEVEFQAALTFMSPPTPVFSKPAIYPRAGMIAGMFAGKKTALVLAQTGELFSDYIADAMYAFSSSVFMINVGVMHSFIDDYANGDVIVAEQVADLQNFEYSSDGGIIDHGQTVNTVHKLRSIFCTNLNIVPQFQASTNGRHASVHSGLVVSYPINMMNKEERNKFAAAMPTAIGGEMNSRYFFDYINRGNLEGAIIIKGVSTDGPDSGWGYTAAMASLAYVEYKLLNCPADLMV